MFKEREKNKIMVNHFVKSILLAPFIRGSIAKEI
jgi:hypothetical protein